MGLDKEIKTPYVVTGHGFQPCLSSQMVGSCGVMADGRFPQHGLGANNLNQSRQRKLRAVHPVPRRKSLDVHKLRHGCSREAVGRGIKAAPKSVADNIAG